MMLAKVIVSMGGDSGGSNPHMVAGWTGQIQLEITGTFMHTFGVHIVA